MLLKEGWVVYEVMYCVLLILSPITCPLTVLLTLAQQASAIFPIAPAMIGM
ncbi:MAG: hypothetical protein ACBZ72_13845 [Candidatus Bathyarchaeia archaeon]